MVIKTDLIPVKQHHIDVTKNLLLPANYNFSSETLDLESIAFFVATGFFFGDRTYYKNIRTLPPGSIATTQDKEIVSIKEYWDWYYNPVVVDLHEAVDKFQAVFEEILRKKLNDYEVILPLSGGIDSRTIAAALPVGPKNLRAYSYEFESGVKEIKYAKRIAEAKEFNFYEYTIPKGYLWDKIDELSEILQHYSEFTHSRQMAVIDELERLGNIFFLGHGGEIFSAPVVRQNETFEGIVDFLYNFLVGKECFELGQELWNLWGLNGSFSSFIRDTISEYLGKINIEEPKSRVRAFIYKYVASRKNQVAVNIFARNKEIFLPFLEEEVLDLICNFDEGLLESRKIQIEYIKRKSPALAAIPWQNYNPLNLYNYQNFNRISYWPLRVKNYLGRMVDNHVLGEYKVQRNWENQLLGKENDSKLKKYLQAKPFLNNLVPQTMLDEYYNKFKSGDKKAFVKPLGILLTLAHFQAARNQKLEVPEKEVLNKTENLLN